jgi:hypothetical protein
MMRMIMTLSLAATALSACGLKGDLATPGPMWNKDREVVERDLPGGQTSSDRIVFTRDDVDLFRDDPAAVDPFAETEEEAVQQGVPPLEPAPDAPPEVPPEAPPQ